MVQRSSVRQQRLLRELGENIARWRKLNGLSASQLAERAFITRETLRHLESGSGSPRLESVFAVLVALGIADAVVEATDPYSNEAARARIDDFLRGGGSW
jgi:transcriptional regulator with XRE-family HTH domain